MVRAAGSGQVVGALLAEIDLRFVRDWLAPARSATQEAYVLDERGEFKRCVNLGMVDLEPLVDTDDVETVKDLLARHIRHTQSPVAARLR